MHAQGEAEQRAWVVHERVELLRILGAHGPARLVDVGVEGGAGVASRGKRDGAVL